MKRRPTNYFTAMVFMMSFAVWVLGGGLVFSQTPAGDPPDPPPAVQEEPIVSEDQGEVIERGIRRGDHRGQQKLAPPPQGTLPTPGTSSPIIRDHRTPSTPVPLTSAPGMFGSENAVMGTLSTGLTSAYPGEFAFRTQKGYYLTAINGGGRQGDPTIITDATSAGAWEKFKLASATPPSPHDKTIQTASGHYVTAVNGGGMTANVLHTDSTQVKDWERFRLIDLGIGIPSNPTYYGIQTIKGNYLTAVGGGGKYQDAMHTDAREIKGWEQFRIVKCGDPGSAYEYGVMAANSAFLTASNGGGQNSGVLLGGPYGLHSKFKLFRQSDGTYALQTGNGQNYLTALGGGGQVQKYNPPDCGMFSACIGGFSNIFHADATQIKGWEKFRVIDQGNCTYAIQTASGFYMGIYKDPSGGYMSLTTRRDGASTPNEKFQLVVYGLASPVVLQ